MDGFKLVVTQIQAFQNWKGIEGYEILARVEDRSRGAQLVVRKT
jgi:hypothetical protein